MERQAKTWPLLDPNLGIVEGWLYREVIYADAVEDAGEAVGMGSDEVQYTGGPSGRRDGYMVVQSSRECKKAGTNSFESPFGLGRRVGNFHTGDL